MMSMPNQRMTARLVTLTLICIVVCFRR
jgi:hypothetical protein